MRLVAFVCLLFATSGAVAETKVTFALANNYEPLMAQDGGIAGEILKEANARLPEGYSIVIELAPWARGVARVERGDAQALVGTYYRPEIRPWIDPYSEPLMEDPVSIFCRTGAAGPNWSYPNDYAGLRFGYLIGSYAAGAAFDAMREAGSISVRENTTIRGSLKMLNAGRVDCFVEGRYAIQSELSSLNNSENIELVNDVASENFYVGFQSDWAATDAASSFIAAFNETIRDMRMDGTIDQILHDALN